MGSIVAENRKSLMLFSGQGFPELAEEIGQVLGVGAARVCQIKKSAHDRLKRSLQRRLG